ncbi:sugar phosphate isomerase/epimerase family protein [Cohnella terricola]|uniref:Sugar phosphate isomerase/epimerase n=1 Tax=Cohnella terricola TaxID=1289167 RepID=A0A559JBZ7_9BACL|nr:sugar phosphate isomerase/epimerase family protein [Cohnella terricola]TVX97400.1 sugar phosphate isomerase/epimerase [Cohnella terricola]
MTQFKGKTAVHAITWGDNHLLALDEASKLGFQAIEPWPSFALQYEGQASELTELLEEKKLRMTALYGGASGEASRRFADVSKRQDIIDFNVRLAKIASQCGAGHIVFGPGGPRQGPATLDELKIAAQTIDEAAKSIYQLGVKACLHPHLWTEIENQHELEALLEMCDPDVVFFAPDTAHLTGAGMDPAQLIRKYKERVAYVHLKDLTKEDAKIEDFPMLIGNEALPVFCELGLGRISFQPIIEALIDIEYDSWLTVEIDRSTSTPYQSLEICRNFVENELGIPVRAVNPGV